MRKNRMKFDKRLKEVQEATKEKQEENKRCVRSK
jgi:hypothetical protein